MPGFGSSDGVSRLAELEDVDTSTASQGATLRLEEATPATVTGIANLDPATNYTVGPDNNTFDVTIIGGDTFAVTVPEGGYSGATGLEFAVGLGLSAHAGLDLAVTVTADGANLVLYGPATFSVKGTFISTFVINVVGPDVNVMSTEASDSGWTAQPLPAPGATTLAELSDVDTSAAGAGSQLFLRAAESAKLLGTRDLYQQTVTIDVTNEWLQFSFSDTGESTYLNVPHGDLVGAAGVASAVQTLLDADGLTAGLVTAGYEQVGATVVLTLTSSRAFDVNDSFASSVMGLSALPASSTTPVEASWTADAGQWQTFTPEVHDALGGQPALGSAYAFGLYRVVGNVAHFHVMFEYATDIAAFAGAILVYLPTELNVRNDIPMTCAARFLDASGADPKLPAGANPAIIDATGVVFPDPAAVFAAVGGAAVGTDNWPFTPANGDRLVFSGTVPLNV